MECTNRDESKICKRISGANRSCRQCKCIWYNVAIFILQLDLRINKGHSPHNGARLLWFPPGQALWDLALHSWYLSRVDRSDARVHEAVWLLSTENNVLYLKIYFETKGEIILSFYLYWGSNWVYEALHCWSFHDKYS